MDSRSEQEKKQKVRSFFGRIGGKRLLVKRILPYFPKEIKIYVEPFLGAGNLFLGLPSRPSYSILNDLDRDIYDLWNDLKHLSVSDIDSFDFIKNPSRKTFHQLVESSPTDKKERFFRNLFISKFSFGSNRRSFAYSNSNSFFNDSSKNNLIHLRNLLQKNVLIKNRDYKEILQEYDSKDTLFYFDPPYEESSSNDYVHHSFDKQELLNSLKKIKGKFVLSYNYSTENVRFFSDFRVLVLDDVSYTRDTFSRKDDWNKHKEILVMNY